MHYPFQFCTAGSLADETIDQPDAAPQEPQEGAETETIFTSWSELVYEMTHGAMGTPPHSKSPKQPPPQKR